VPNDQTQTTVVVLPTSGTTGEPKLVALTRANIDASVKAWVHAMDLKHTDRCLNVMPAWHGGLISNLLASCSVGATVVSAKATSAFELWECEGGLDAEADGLAAFYAERLAAAQQNTDPRSSTAERPAEGLGDAGPTPGGVAAPTPQKSARGTGFDWPGYVEAITKWAATVEDYRIIERFRVDHARHIEHLRLANAKARDDLLRALAERERILRGGEP
jgi:hypothetical protein